MIRMVQSTNAKQAKDYYTSALNTGDYYTNDQEWPGRFFGRLGHRIGLGGEVKKEVFFALCDNIDPKTGSSLTPITRGDRTVGYDINFHSPKSVSVVSALSHDDHMVKAFQSSVHETMLEIEKDSMTRLRAKGAYEDKLTGELLWAEFTHFTARPVDGSNPDPHLHSHCYVFNATYFEQENKIKAVQFREINRSMPYYQARFHKTFSDKLIDLGYQIRKTDKSFEIEGVPQSAIDLFSKRTDEIGQFAKEKGIADAKALGELGARTRSAKQKGLNMAELKQDWRDQIRQHAVYKDSEEDKAIRYAPQMIVSKEVAADCVDFAVKHTFERASVMADRRILETAYRHSIGKRAIGMEDITNGFNARDDIIHIKDKYRTLCTTEPVLQEEKEMVKLARQGQGKFRPLMSKVPYNDKLNDQQNAAIEHVLTTTNQVSIIKGAAGTGKTTIMKSTNKLIAQSGKAMFVVAPTSHASRGVLVEEGFENATTVSQLLVDKELQNQLLGQVLWVDEAGLLGTQQMRQVLEIAKQQNARVILGGDTAQHTSVVRGDALRILNTVGGIKTAEVNKILRQKDIHYKAAVEDLHKGNTGSAFIKLSSIGAIKNIDPLKPNDLLVKDYMGAVKKGKSALIVSPTHQQGEAVTKDIRKHLKEARLLGKREMAAVKLSNMNMTEAQKSDYRNLAKGQIVQFNQNAPNIKRGSMWEVSEISKDIVTIKDANGEQRQLPQHKASAFEIYAQNEIGLSRGDKVRITRNSFDEDKKRLNNGQSLKVHAIDKFGKITLINEAKTEFKLDRSFGHLSHDYCTTSHSSQGKTVDEVFISQPSSTFVATDAKQFYVSVSRGKEKATIYTDDRVALLEYAAELRDRQSALELLGEHKHSGYVEQMQRTAYEVGNDPEKLTNYEHELTLDIDHEPGF